MNQFRSYPNGFGTYFGAPLLGGFMGSLLGQTFYPPYRYPYEQYQYWHPPFMPYPQHYPEYRRHRHWES